MRKNYENGVLRPAIIDKLTKLNYNVEITHGSMYMTGWPDLYITHKHREPCWVELKRDNFQKLRPSQVQMFTKWTRFGVRIYVVHLVSEVPDIFYKSPNWYEYHLRTM